MRRDWMLAVLAATETERWPLVEMLQRPGYLRSRGEPEPAAAEQVPPDVVRERWLLRDVCLAGLLV